MNNLFVIFIPAIELLMVLQCLQVVFKQKLRFDKYTIGIVLANICIYAGINFKIVPTISSLLFYVLLFGYCYKKFKLTVIKTITRLIIAISLAGCTEVVIGYAMKRSMLIKDDTFVLLISNTLALVVTIILNRKLPLFERMIKGKRNMAISAGGIFYVLLLGGLLVGYYLKQRMIKLDVVIILISMVCIFVHLYKLEQVQNEIDKKNYELEVKRVYEDAYAELLGEVRRRQHDFKNQLSAIYSMHLTAHSLEELVTMQQEYGNILRENSKFDSILLGCENKILAGYLYYRCISCEKEGINVDYEICVEQAACCWPIHEIIEVLGILIDNACEELSLGERENGCIKIVFREEKERILIVVSNPTTYDITYAEIDEMFKYGYSTKGERRGIGLTRVSELVKKHRAEIGVFINQFNEENWINFAIKIAV